MDEKEIDLDAFIEGWKSNLEGFKAYWLEQHAKDPESWPLRVMPHEFEEAMVGYFGWR